MGTILKVALGVILGVGMAALAWSFSPISITRQSPSTINISYIDFVSIMLTAVSVILAGLGFVIALLAFIGWNSIGNKVSASSKEFLRESVKDGGELHTLVRNEAKEIIYQGIEPVDIEFNDDEVEKEA